MPREPQATVHREPDERRRHVAKKRRTLGVHVARRDRGCSGRLQATILLAALAASGSGGDAHHLAGRVDVNGDGATKDRDTVEGLRERDVSQPGRSTDVVAQDPHRLQISVVEAEPIDGLHQLVSQGRRQGPTAGRPARPLEHAYGARVGVQARAAPVARRRGAPHFGPCSRGADSRPALCANVEVRASGSKPLRRLLSRGQGAGKSHQHRDAEDEAETGPERHAAAPFCNEAKHPGACEGKLGRRAKFRPRRRLRSSRSWRHLTRLC